MLQRLDLRDAAGDVASLLPRPDPPGDLPREAVEAIIDEVRRRGDQALLELTRRFDGVELDHLRVPDGEVRRALRDCPAELRRSLEVAAESVGAYHRSQLVAPDPFRRAGLEVGTLRVPVARAGVYVPGGRARYPSTVVMTAVPARVAGVGEVAMCVPPGPGGTVDPATLAAAALTGVDEVFCLGGAQAIAAMAYGTETVRRVDVVAGPGNLYVALAQRAVAGVVGVPSAFAGPSEVVVVADHSTPAVLAAVDLVVQAEHGPDGLAWLVTWSPSAADAVCRAVAGVVATSRRPDEVAATLAKSGYAVVVDSPGRAMEVVNLIAPEHLEIMSDDPGSLVASVRNAGAVFLGPWAPASVGDYLAGPSHVLPTHGSARFAGALGVSDFQKDVHVISLDRAGLERVAPHVSVLAEAEGLVAHAESVRARQAMP